MREIFMFDKYGVRHYLPLDGELLYIYVFVVDGGERLLITWANNVTEEYSNPEDDYFGRYEGNYLVRPHQLEIWNQRTSSRQWLRNYEWED